MNSKPARKYKSSRKYDTDDIDDANDPRSPSVPAARARAAKDIQKRSFKNVPIWDRLFVPWCLEDWFRRLPPASKLVLMALLCHAYGRDGDGREKIECWPGHKRLVACTGLCRSTVRRALQELHLAGHIKIDPPGLKHRSCTYRLLFKVKK